MQKLEEHKFGFHKGERVKVKGFKGVTSGYVVRFDVPGTEGEELNYILIVTNKDYIEKLYSQETVYGHSRDEYRCRWFKPGDLEHTCRLNRNR